MASQQKRRFEAQIEDQSGPPGVGVALLEFIFPLLPSRNRIWRRCSLDDYLRLSSYVRISRRCEEENLNKNLVTSGKVLREGTNVSG